MNRLKAAIEKPVSKIGNTLKKSSPEILIITGTIGVVAGAVMACKASTKVGKIVDEAKDISGKIQETVEAEDNDYTEKDAQKDMVLLCTETTGKLLKLYGPAIIVFGTSLSAMIFSHGILKKRTMAITAAYTMLDKGFKDYRARVIEEFGEEKDQDLRFGLETRECEVHHIDENGNDSVKVNKMKTIDPNNISVYAKIFDESNPNWTKNPEYNLMFVKKVSSYLNDLLKARGIGGKVYLNEVYEAFGFDKTDVGQVVGWIYNPEDPTRDSYIDCGLYNEDNPRAAAFVNGYESCLLMDFNVDGVIIQL